MKEEKVIRLRLSALLKKARQAFAREFFAKTPTSCSRSSPTGQKDTTLVAQITVLNGLRVICMKHSGRR